MGYKIAVIPGDGIGPEVTNSAVQVLKALNLDMEFVICEAGLKSWERYGKQLTEEMLEVIKRSDACLKGPTQTPEGPESYRSVAVTLRQTLDLYANVRPIKSRKGVPALHQNVNFVIVRENTEGLYAGIEERKGETALAARVITRRGSERIARFAFDLALAEGRKKVTIVHKANILKITCGLFREVCLEVAKGYPSIEVEELMVDAAAHRIVRRPQDLDVLVTTNLFGDILSDEAAGVVGGLGVVPGANIGARHAMFEPVHGVALKYAGKGVVNPSAMILSAAMMLKYLGEEKNALKLERALEKVLEEGKVVTKDLGGNASTQAMTEETIRILETL
ncbi:MAG: isocitrate/isopropylmalate dehydrogenase family protein [Candidatus Bathyarchaeia archaeon]